MTRITPIRADITQLAVDAIVNAANSRLVGGGGVDGAIHAAGGPTILEECRLWVAEHGPLPTGQAMVTSGGNLQARHVIHTVGPVWDQHDEDEARDLLASCYSRSLDRASDRECRSVAFPNISTGVYGYPKNLAAPTAVATVRAWVDASRDLDEIVFACFDQENLAIYSGLLES